MRISGSFCTTMSVVFLVWVLSVSCLTKEKTSVTTSNARYVVTARHESGPATTPYSLSITYRRLDESAGQERLLVEEVGHHRRASLNLREDNLLLATTRDGLGTFYKFYYLTNLDYPPSDKFVNWYAEKIQVDSIVWQDEYSDHTLEVSCLDHPANVHRLRYDTRWGKLDLYILGAEYVEKRDYQSRSLDLEITWQGGNTAQGLTLKLPEEGTGFVEICPNE